MSLFKDVLKDRLDIYLYRVNLEKKFFRFYTYEYYSYFIGLIKVLIYIVINMKKKYFHHFNFAIIQLI